MQRQELENRINTLEIRKTKLLTELAVIEVVLKEEKERLEGLNQLESVLDI